MTHLRVCKRKQPDGSFTECSFRELKKGDEFVMFEPDDGEPVDGGRVFTAETDAQPPAPLSLDSRVEGDDRERPWCIQVAE